MEKSRGAILQMECTGTLLILYILNLQISGKSSDKSETSETQRGGFGPVLM